MSETVQAAIAIIGFFVGVILLAGLLRALGTALAVVIVTGLLGVALVLQYAIGTSIFAALAFALTIAAVALRWAFDVAVWGSERRPRPRRTS